MKEQKLITLFFLLITGFVFAQGTWTKVKDKPGNATHEMGAFTINGKAYIVGGAIAYPNWSNETWEYDPAGAGTWTKKADVNSAGLREPIAFSIGNKGYAGTGMTSTSLVKTFYEFDPIADSWTPKTNFGGTARRDAMGFSIGNKGYVGTGADATSGTKDIWEYDPAGSGSWVKKNDFLGVIRNASTGFSIGTKGYITTGRQGTSTYNDFWEYDPAFDSWTQKVNYPGVTRSECVSFVIGTKAYIGLGHTGGVTDFWSYDQSLNSWGTVTNFPGTGAERFESVGFSIGNKGYVCAGIILGTGSQLDLWEFDPGTVGINEPNNTIGFSVYPNPSKGKFKISADNNQISSLKIYNLQGEKIIDRLSVPDNAVIDISNYPNGIYLLKVKSGNDSDGYSEGARKISIQK